MTDLVCVHGAFRGGWAWARVRPGLEAAGHRVWAPSLVGMGELAPAAPAAPAVAAGSPGSAGSVGLEDWTSQVVALVEQWDLTDVVLVAHSQGGLVVRAVGDRLGPRLKGVAYLDAAVPGRGERGVDLTPGGAPDGLPPRDTWIPPTPLTADRLHPPEVVAWANERLCSTPLGPSLDPVASDAADVPTVYAFCSGTPDGYPSTTTRARLADAGVPHEVLDAPHDAPLTHPEVVIGWILGRLGAMTASPG